MLNFSNSLFSFFVLNKQRNLRLKKKALSSSHSSNTKLTTGVLRQKKNCVQKKLHILFQQGS